MYSKYTAYTVSLYRTLRNGNRVTGPPLSPQTPPSLLTLVPVSLSSLFFLSSTSPPPPNSTASPSALDSPVQPR